MIVNGKTLELPTKVKLIFWDFDGVFNRLDGANTTKHKSWRGSIGFEPEIINNLNYLCSQLDKDWDFIISSSWRIHGMGDCLRSLLDAGFDQTQLQRWISRTGKNKTRGHEVVDYIGRYRLPVEFIVIDDEKFDLIGEYELLTDEIRDLIRPNFYQTNMKEGLTMTDVNKILEMSRR